MTKYNIRRGSIISESNYGVTLVSEITTDVQTISPESSKHFAQQTFFARVIEINGVPKYEGSVIEYQVGGTYGPDIEVIKY